MTKRTKPAELPERCDCGGRMIYAHSLGRIFSACDTCSPVIDMTAALKRIPSASEPARRGPKPDDGSNRQRSIRLVALRAKILSGSDPVSFPTSVRYHRTLEAAFVEGVRAGRIAEPGGVPISKYKQRNTRAAFTEGFARGQATR